MRSLTLICNMFILGRLCWCCHRLSLQARNCVSFHKRRAIDDGYLGWCLHTVSRDKKTSLYVRALESEIYLPTLTFMVAGFL